MHHVVKANSALWMYTSKKNVVELKVLDLLLAVKVEKLENLNSLSTVFPHSNDPTVSK